MADVNISKYRASVVRDGSKPASPGFVVSEGQDPVNPPGTNNYVPYSGATANVELGEFGVEAGFVTLDTTPTNIPTDQGAIYWDDTRSTAALIMNGTLQHIGQDAFFYVKNSSAYTIPKGTCVRFAGTDGASGHLLILPFTANGVFPSSYFMGVTAEDIANGEFGQVMHFGELTGINTSGFTAGDLLYASSTVAGAFQTTVPVAPNNIVLVAAAVNSKNNGAIVVRPTYGSNINIDEGVKITSPTTGDLLQLQAGGLWENKTLAQVIGSAYVPSTRTITINGTTQDLSANRTFNVGTVTSVGLSSATSGVTIGSTPVTTSGTITLAIATASGSQNGLLSSTDWTTFNNKIGGTLATGQVAFGTAANTIGGDNGLFWDNTNKRLGVGTTTPFTKFDVANGNIGSGINNLAFFGLQQIGNPSIGDGVRINLGTSAGITRAAAIEAVVSSGLNGHHLAFLTNASGNIPTERWRITSTGILQSNGAQTIQTSTGALTLATAAGNGNIVLSPNGTGVVTTNNSVGIGTTSLTQYVLRVSKNITGSTTSYGISQEGIVQSDVITRTFGILNNLSTQATTFTLNEYFHFATNQASIGAGSAVTTQYGYHVGSSLTGATNNYGFFGNIPSGTNRWNLYMNGTAANYLAGNLLIGTTTDAGFRLDVNGTARVTSTMRIGTINNGVGDFITTDANGVLTRRTAAQTLTDIGAQSALTNPVTGTGTTNYLPKFTGSTTVGNSQIFDNGNGIGINTTSPYTATNFTFITTNNTSGSGYVTRVNGTFSALIYSSASGTIISEQRALPLIFETSGNTRATLDANGNLGLGVTPSAWMGGSAALQVIRGGLWHDGSGYISLFNNAYYDGSNWRYIASTWATNFAQVNGNFQWFQASSGTAGNAISFTQAMTLNPSGNLLVGTTTDNGARLQVSGTGTISAASTDYALTLQNIQDDSQGLLIRSTDNDGGLYLIRAQSSNSSVSQTWVDRFSLTKSGNVGIGTSSPDVYGFGASGRYLTLQNTGGFSLMQVISNGTDGSGINFGNATIRRASIDALNGSDLAFFTNGTNSGTGITERMRITAGGEVLIGNTDNGAYNLQCNGTGVWGAGAYVNGSDRNIKDNIATIEKGLEYIQKMNPVKFRYKPNYTRDHSMQTGFIAQELQEVFASEDYLSGLVQQGVHLSVAYQNLLPVLVKAIQELKQEIDTLKN